MASSETLSHKPLPPAEVKRIVLAACGTGGVSFTQHALQEMEQDGITQDEAIAALRGGVVEPGELERGSWRYRVRVPRMLAVVAVRSESSVAVVTAWRLTR